jgi:protein O-GlcNAc transferase
MQESGHPSVRAMFAQALALHQNGNLDAAAAEYEKIIGLQPSHADALHHLGLVFLQRGEFAEAIPYIRKSLDENPRQPNAHSNLAHCYNLADRPAEALASCDAALSFDAGNTAALANKGNALRALQRYDEALEVFETVVRLTPRDARAIYNVAVTLFDLGLFERAAAGFIRRSGSTLPQPGSSSVTWKRP